MKQFYYSIFTLIVCQICNAQTINFPDSNFKDYLVNQNCVDLNGDWIPDGDVDTNNDGEIQLSEAAAVFSLEINSSCTATDISGIENFINLNSFNCVNTSITELNLSVITQVSLLRIYGNNNLATIDLSGLTYAGPASTSNEFYIAENNVTNINLQNLVNVDLRMSIQGDETSNINVNFASLTNLNDSISFSYNSSELSMPNLVNAYDIAITGDFLEINMPLLETIFYSLYIQTENEVLNSINLDSLTSLTDLNLNNNSLESISLENLTTVEDISIRNNVLTSFNIENLTTVDKIQLNGNLLTELSLTDLDIQQTLNLSSNPLTDLNLENVSMSSLLISNSDIFSLDLSNAYLGGLSVSNDNNLFNIDLKNGESISGLNLTNVPNLAYICADDDEQEMINNSLTNQNITNCEVNSYCSFFPGGTYYTNEGESNFDSDNSGCDPLDAPAPNLRLEINDGVTQRIVVANSAGQYIVHFANEGNYTITPKVDFQEYFSIEPAVLNLDFPSDTSPFTQNLCIAPNGNHNDLEAIIFPLTDAIPGFDVTYRAVYRNVGTTVLSGNVELNYSFISDYIQYVSSIPTETSQSIGVLSWDYDNLEPFETRMIDITFNLNTPVDENFPLNSGDELNYDVSIFPVVGDETPINNETGLKHVVVNSFDPNDIRCLEGEFILPERVGEYVHYLVRFENLGTANATNIVVNNSIDITKFDISTLIPLNGSHDYYTRINPDNDVEFIFENIQLPFDDANNDGYVTYKIKTLETLVLGDMFTNQAEIYFDFNAPVITNSYTTEISEDELSENEFSIQNTKVYPNPVNDILTIRSDEILTNAKIYDVNGREILTSEFEGSNYQLNLSALESGLYFLKVYSNSGHVTLEVVKR